MKTLILYASKTGVTKDIALMIKDSCQTDITLMDVEDCPANLLSQYELIVLGAPIYMGYVHRSMRKFVFKHLDFLITKRFFIFSVGADATIDLDKYLAMSYPKALLDATISTMYLGGEFRMESLNPIKRFITKQVSDELQKCGPSEVKIHTHNIKVFTQQLADYIIHSQEKGRFFDETSSTNISKRDT